MNIDPNDYVYPMAASTGDPRDGVYCQNGLTIRAHFAAKAMQGLLANPLVLEVQCDHEITERATKLADLLIAALSA